MVGGCGGYVVGGCGGYVVGGCRGYVVGGCRGYVVGGWFSSDNHATSWPILQAETFQIFSWAEISRWTECGNNLFSLTITVCLFIIYLKQSWKKLSTQDHTFS